MECVHASHYVLLFFVTVRWPRFATAGSYANRNALDRFVAPIAARIYTTADRSSGGRTIAIPSGMEGTSLAFRRQSAELAPC